MKRLWLFAKHDSKSLLNLLVVNIVFTQIFNCASSDCSQSVFQLSICGVMSPF